MTIDDNKTPDINDILKKTNTLIQVAQMACDEASNLIMPAKTIMGIGSLVGGVLLAHIVEIAESINHAYAYLDYINDRELSLDDLIDYARKAVKEYPALTHLTKFLAVMDELKNKLSDNE